MTRPDEELHPQVTKAIARLIQCAREGLTGELRVQFHEGLPQRAHITTTETFNRNRP